jgi:hypothetical protein
MLDQSLRPLLRACLERHGRLCSDGGEKATGEEALRLAQRFGDT